MYIPRDKFAQRAKKEGFLARSAYKLLDIQQKFRILRSGDYVLDLGAAPGSWLQVASKIVGSKGYIIAVDTRVIRPLNLPRIATFSKDIFAPNLVEFLKEYGFASFDVILSDVAPSTTGITEVDQTQSHKLATRSLEIAKGILKKGGNAVFKVFEGPDTPQLLKEMEQLFLSTKPIKPVASAKGSKELYIVATGFYGGAFRRC